MAKHGAHAAKRAIRSKAGRARVSAKIRHLHKAEPEMPQKQKVAMALSMERAGRLGKRGAYRPVKKRKPRRK